MRGKGANNRQRLAAALALCGVLTYSALIPGHLVSQLVKELVGSPVTAAAAAEPHCHETGEKAPSEPKPANKHALLHRLRRLPIDGIVVARLIPLAGNAGGRRARRDRSKPSLPARPQRL
jgi:hypothetical protein